MSVRTALTPFLFHFNRLSSVCSYLSTIKLFIAILQIAFATAYNCYYFKVKTVHYMRVFVVLLAIIQRWIERVRDCFKEQSHVSIARAKLTLGLKSFDLYHQPCQQRSMICLPNPSHHDISFAFSPLHIVALTCGGSIFLTCSVEDSCGD